MSGNAEYNDYWLELHDDGSPAQLAARRTRRRRRHGKKQAPEWEAFSEDGRGRWLPPASATSLTLAELGIHVEPPAYGECQGDSLTLAQLGIHISPPAHPPRPMVDAVRRNVVTCSDLNLFGDSSKALPSQGNLGIRSAPPLPMQPPQKQQHLPAAPAPWQCTDERPWERILSVPSPQSGSNLAATSPMGHHYAVAPPIQPAPPWHAQQDPALYWLSSGQYSTQATYHSSPSDRGMLLEPAPPNFVQPIFHNDLSSSMLLEPASSPPPVAAPSMVADPASGGVNEVSKLETLLEHLAADVYQD